MRYHIAENRLENILQRDKVNDPQRVCEILKGEINNAIGSFLSLFLPIVIRFPKVG